MPRHHVTLAKRRNALRGWRCSRNQTHSHGTTGPMMHSSAVPPGRMHAASPSTTESSSLTQFNPPKFDSAPSNVPSVASSAIDSARSCRASTPRRSRAMATISAAASVATTTTPRSPSHMASTPVPQFSSTTRLPAGHNSSIRRHTALRMIVPIALSVKVSSYSAASASNGVGVVQTSTSSAQANRLSRASSAASALTVAATGSVSIKRCASTALTSHESACL